jgi:outer membrane protein assembly factor BamC
VQKWAKGFVTISVLLSGCAIFEKEAPENHRAEQIELKIPAGLAVPNQPSAYDIPQIQTSGAAQVDKKSPTLILATATSSRLDEEEKQARVWFERNDYTGDLLPFVQNQLQAFFASQEIGLTQTDEQGLVYQTDWIKRSKSSGFWFWKEEQAVDQLRYQIELAPRPHGRTLSATVTLLEHQFFDAGTPLNAQEAKAAEVNLLNRLINQVAITEVQIARELRQQVAAVSLEPGLDNAGNPALLSTQPIDVTWSQLEVLFGELNLTVTDFDRSVFTYFVNYTRPERSIWRAVTFRDAPLGLPLDDGDYQLVLSKTANNGTAISWLNKNGEALSPAQVAALLDPVVAAIRASGAEL